MCTNAVTEETPESLRDKLICEYKDYVNSVVGTLVKAMGLPMQLFDEFVSAGYLGLVEAASRYNPSTGGDFKTYAYFRIRGAVIDSIRECADNSGKAYRYIKALQASHTMREDTMEVEGYTSTSGDSNSGGSRDEALAEVLDFAAKGVLAFRLSVDDAEEELYNELGSPTTPEEFLNYFQSNLLKSKLPRTRISTVFKKWVSEDGGRFYKKKNLIHIIKVSHNEQINLPENYIWIDETNLVKLNLLKKPIVNCHVRSILSFTGYFKRLS